MFLHGRTAKCPKRWNVPIRDWANRYEVCASNIISSCHVETVVCLSNKNARSKDYIEIGLDVEDYYRIKDSAGADKCGGAEEDE